MINRGLFNKIKVFFPAWRGKSAAVEPETSHPKSQSENSKQKEPGKFDPSILFREARLTHQDIKQQALTKLREEAQKKSEDDTNKIASKTKRSKTTTAKKIIKSEKSFKKRKTASAKSSAESQENILEKARFLTGNLEIYSSNLNDVQAEIIKLEAKLKPLLKSKLKELDSLILENIEILEDYHFYIKEEERLTQLRQKNIAEQKLLQGKTKAKLNYDSFREANLARKFKYSFDSSKSLECLRKQEADLRKDIKQLNYDAAKKYNKQEYYDFLEEYSTKIKNRIQNLLAQIKAMNSSFTAEQIRASDEMKELALLNQKSIATECLEYIVNKEFNTDEINIAKAKLEQNLAQQLVTMLEDKFYASKSVKSFLKEMILNSGSLTRIVHTTSYQNENYKISSFDILQALFIDAEKMPVYLFQALAEAAEFNESPDENDLGGFNELRIYVALLYMQDTGLIKGFEMSENRDFHDQRKIDFCVEDLDGMLFPIQSKSNSDEIKEWKEHYNIEVIVPSSMSYREMVRRAIPRAHERSTLINAQEYNSLDYSAKNDLIVRTYLKGVPIDPLTLSYNNSKKC